ncbi:MAG: hypothetical protein WCW56_02480 [Candidatus Paceibacterota bacterium]|jgi:hypothetical protein
MDSNSKLTSFIPKNSTSPSGLTGIPTGGNISRASSSSSSPRLSGAYSFLGVVSFALLAVTLVFTAGAFIYRLMAFQKVYNPCNEQGSCGLVESLKRDRQQLGTENLIRAKRLEVKTSNGRSLLDQHVSVSPLFRQIFSPLTSEGISYKSFDFGEKGVIIGGQARSYEDVAFQAEVFNSKDAKGKVKSYRFYDLNLDDKGNVIFKLDLAPDSSILSFSKASLQMPTQQ